MAILKDLLVQSDARVVGVTRSASFEGDGLLAATSGNRANNKVWNTNGGFITVDAADEKVNQSQTTTSSYRGVVLGYNSNASSGTGIDGSVTNVVYTTNNLTVQPSTGNFHTKGTIQSKDIYSITSATYNVGTSGNVWNTVWAQNFKSNSSLIVASSGNTAISMQTSGATRMTIDGSGYVGINMSPNSSYRLAVSGNVIASGSTAKLYSTGLKHTDASLTAQTPTVKVWSTDGEYVEASAISINDIYNIVYDETPVPEDIQLWYGIQYDTTVASTNCTRIGNPQLHRTLPIHNKMRGCLLNDSGVVVKYLNSSDWTQETRDGSSGQVMVEIPTYYRKFETSGTTNIVKISEFPIEGFTKVNTHYCSAYEASLQRSTNKLSSVVNTSTDYRGGTNNSSWDGTYRSLLGMPVTNVSRTNFRTYARNRGSNKWNENTLFIQEELYWLFVIEYATKNCQASYNPQLDANGYHQGGLGAGVTNISDWNGYNSYNPIIPCGSTDSLGNRTGVVNYNVMSSGGTVYYQAPVPRYRGIENPFGHIWKWTDGINVLINPSGDTDPTSKVYRCDNPANFADGTSTNYTYVGDEARTNNYVQEIIFGDTGCIIPKTVGSSSYFGDYHYTSIPTSASWRAVFFGGAANPGSYAGFVCASSSHAASHTAAYLGSRLCFFPS